MNNESQPVNSVAEVSLEKMPKKRSRRDPETILKEWADWSARFPDSKLGFSESINILISLERFEEAKDILTKASKRFPNEFSFLIQKAHLLKAEGSIEEAFTQFQNALKRYPDNRTSYTAIVEFLQENERLEEADKILQMATERFPEDKRLYKLYCALGSKFKDDPNKQTRWFGMIERFPDMLSGYMPAINHLIAQKDFQQADDLINRALERFPEDKGLWMKSCQVARNLNDPELSLKRWQTLVLRFDVEGPYYAELCRQYCALKQFDEAERVLKSGMATYPDDFSLFKEYCQIAKLKGLPVEDQIQRWKEMINRFPEQLIGYASLIRILMGLKQHEEAEQYIVIARDKFPKVVGLSRWYAIIAKEQNKLEEALKRWNEFIALFPDTEVGYLEALKIQIELKQFEAAEKTAVNGLKSCANSFGLYRLWAAVARSQNKKELWIERSREIIKKFPQIPAGYIGLSAALATVQRFEEAQEVIDQALTIFPESKDLVRIQSNYYIRKGDVDSAIDEWKSFFRAKPELADGYYEAAKLLFGLGRILEAEHIIEEAISHGVKDLNIYRLRCELAEQSGDIAQIERCYQLLIQDFNDIEAEINYIKYLILSKKVDDSVERVRQLKAKKIQHVMLDYYDCYLSVARKVEAEKMEASIKILCQHTELSLSLFEDLIDELLDHQYVSQADALLQNILKRYPESRRLWALYGKVGGLRYDSTTALDRWVQIIQHQPDVVEAYIGAANILMVLGQYNEAQGFLEKGCQCFSNDQTLLFSRGLLANHLEKDPSKLIAQWKHYVKCFPQDPNGYQELASILLKYNEFIEAESYLKKALSQWSDNSRLKLLASELTGYQESNLTALVSLKEALKENPENVTISLKIARLLIKMLRLIEAKQWIKTCLTQFEDHLEFEHLYMLVLALEANWLENVDFARKLLVRHPADIEAYRYIALGEFYLKRFDEAINIHSYLVHAGLSETDIGLTAFLIKEEETHFNDIKKQWETLTQHVPIEKKKEIALEKIASNDPVGVVASWVFFNENSKDTTLLEAFIQHWRSKSDIEQVQKSLFKRYLIENIPESSEKVKEIIQQVAFGLPNSNLDLIDLNNAFPPATDAYLDFLIPSTVKDMGIDEIKWLKGQLKKLPEDNHSLQLLLLFRLLFTQSFSKNKKIISDLLESVNSNYKKLTQVPYDHWLHTHYETYYQKYLKEKTPRQKQKIAICIFGDWPAEHTFSIDTLKEHECDIFVHTWSSLAHCEGIADITLQKTLSGQYQTKDEFYRSFPETSFQLENRQVLKKSDIQRLYAPKFIYVEEIDHFEPLGDIALDTAIQRNLYSMNEVNRLRMEWEKKHQCDYDKVIFVSPNQRIKPSYLDSIQDDKTSHNMIHSLLLETHSLSSITFAFGVTSVMTLYGAIWKFIKGLKTNKLAPYVDFSRIIDYYLFIYGLSVNILDVGFSKTNSNTIDYTDSLLNDIFRHEDKKQFYYFFHQYVRELVKNYLERGQLFKAQALIHKLEEHPLASQWFGTFHRATYLIDHYLDQPGINEFKSVCAEREQCSLLYPS